MQEGSGGEGGTEEEAMQLRRQIVELTQRVTMLLANQCAACRLGIVECGLQQQEWDGVREDGGDSDGNDDEESLEDADGDEDGHEDEAGDVAKDQGDADWRGRDRDRERQLEGQLDRLTRRAGRIRFG
jgi:hypothetical protein